MQLIAEVWTNEYGDVAVFVGNEYIIYDKCDRLEVTTVSLTRENKHMEDIKLAYYKNGFRPMSKDRNKRFEISKIEYYEEKLSREKETNEE